MSSPEPFCAVGMIVDVEKMLTPTHAGAAPVKIVAPDGFMGVLFVYKDEAAARAAHPDLQCEFFKLRADDARSP